MSIDLAANLLHALGCEDAPRPFTEPPFLLRKSPREHYCLSHQAFATEWAQPLSPREGSCPGGCPSYNIRPQRPITRASRVLPLITFRLRQPPAQRSVSSPPRRHSPPSALRAWPPSARASSSRLGQVAEPTTALRRRPSCHRRAQSAPAEPISRRAYIATLRARRALSRPPYPTAPCPPGSLEPRRDQDRPAPLLRHCVSIPPWRAARLATAWQLWRLCRPALPGNPAPPCRATS